MIFEGLWKSLVFIWEDSPACVNLNWKQCSCFVLVCAVSSYFDSYFHNYNFTNLYVYIVTLWSIIYIPYVYLHTRIYVRVIGMISNCKFNRFAFILINVVGICVKKIFEKKITKHFNNYYYISITILQRVLIPKHDSDESKHFSISNQTEPNWTDPNWIKHNWILTERESRYAM